MNLTTQQMDRKIEEHFGFEAADNVEGVLATLAPDVTHDIVGYPTGPTRGREKARAFYEQLFNDLAESSVTIIKRLHGDNFMVDESMWEGRAPGRPFGLEGRDRPLKFRILHVVEFTADGQIQREQVWLDMAAIFSSFHRINRGEIFEQRSQQPASSHAQGSSRGRGAPAEKRPRADMDAVAKEAMVSRATAYRYFPSVEALLIEAPLDGAVPGPDDIFAGDRSTDPMSRVEKAEAALHEAVYRNEAQLRAMLAASLERKAKGLATDGIPIRQNRRTGLIEAALAPARNRFTTASYEKLCAALAMIFGTESMIVFSDVLGLDEKTARKVKAWAARSLVNAALQSAAARR